MMRFFVLKKIRYSDFKKSFVDKAIENGKDDKYIDFYLKIAKKQILNNVPVIFNVSHLSMLSGVSKDYLYAVSNGKSENFYIKFELKKNSGGMRPISSPLPNLKIFQKWILINVLNNLDVSDFCK